MRTVGSGAGTADPVTHPNVLRVALADSLATPAPANVEALHLVEATIDDMDPRQWPDVLDAVHRAGAKDVWITPVLMRKGRPGHVVSAIATPSVLEGVCASVFAHTSTLGLRVSDHARRSLSRDVVTVEVDGYPVPVKRGLAAEQVLTVQPEYDEARALAARSGRPVDSVLDEARFRARRIPGRR